MPRTARASRAGICHHVMNRGNGRATIYHEDTDYRSFKGLIRQANERIPMRVLAYCLMPTHFHLVLWPHGDGDLGRWMHWLLTTHVQRHRRRYETVGRIWQGRFHAPPVQQDEHLFVVMRYVERNPLRAGLVDRAEDWPWSSLRARVDASNDLLCPPPIELPDDWVEWVNQPLTAAELDAVRTSLRRGRPYGDPAWVRSTAERLGLMSSLRPPCRPRAWEPGRGV